jgi:hypothetical protein
LDGLEMTDVGIFCGHSVNFPVIWNVLWSFGIFLPFWYVVPRKIWQPCSPHSRLSDGSGFYDANVVMKPIFSRWSDFSKKWNACRARIRQYFSAVENSENSGTVYCRKNAQFRIVGPRPLISSRVPKAFFIEWTYSRNNMVYWKYSVAEILWAARWIPSSFLAALNSLRDCWYFFVKKIGSCHRAGLPDFYWYMIPKPEKLYQMNT